MWELPLFRFFRYQHCHYRSLDIPCYWPEEDAVADRFAEMRTAWQSAAVDSSP